MPLGCNLRVRECLKLSTRVIESSFERTLYPDFVSPEHVAHFHPRLTNLLLLTPQSAFGMTGIRSTVSEQNPTSSPDRGVCPEVHPQCL